MTACAMRPRLVDGIYVDDKNFPALPPVEVCRVMSVKTPGTSGTPCSTSRTWTEPPKGRGLKATTWGQDRTAHKVKPTAAILTTAIPSPL